MDEALQTQINTYLSHLAVLIGRGQQLRQMLEDPSNGSAMAATRAWQEDCGVTINQLSGGSKAHWLARSFSQAFLMRSNSGQAVEGAAPAEIVNRLLEVLVQAVATLSQNNEGRITVASSEQPEPRRFEFIHNTELRPVLEQAYIESRRAFEQAEYDLALRTSCGIIETIVTDALEDKGLNALLASGAPAGKIADWSFQTRLTVAERAGLIHGGCARLPTVGRNYRDQNQGDQNDDATVSERDAQLTSQVLRVIMRDLDPGR
jgi:hypothetical protein